MESLSKTFSLLATTKCLAAVEVLVLALENRSGVIREKAATALLRRGTTRCQTELIRRLPRLSEAIRKQLEAQGARLSPTLRQCLLHGEIELTQNSLELIGSIEAYDQVVTLLQILARRQHPLQEKAHEALKDLVDRLDRHCHPGDHSPSHGRLPRNYSQIRHAVLTALEASCDELDHQSYRKTVIESILILGDPENAAVRKVLLGGSNVCREVAASLLGKSSHAAVMRLLVDFLGSHYPHARAIDALEQRADLPFACYLLQRFSRQFTDNQHKNLRQLTRLGWASSEAQLALIPRELHVPLVGFLQATGIPAPNKIDLQRWILRNGSVEGRLAAGRILDETAPNTVRGILAESLDSDDEEVQAWATTQLRAQGIPEAIHMLVERLDSPLPAVRDAARDELGSFNLELLLGMFEHLDPAVCLRAGALIRKTDPDCIERLMAELAHPVRRRRIQSARAAHALGFATHVEKGLLKLLADSDPQVRRAAVEVLADVGTREVFLALVELLNDVSPRVRDAAEESLEKLHRTGVSFEETATTKATDLTKR